MNDTINTNDDYYIDDEYNENVDFDIEKEKRTFNPKVFLIPIAILILLILLIFIIRAIANNVPLTLKELYVEDEELEPKFKANVYKYSITTEENEIYIGCTAKSKKAKIKGCNKTISLEKGINNHEIVVSFKKKQKKYKIDILKESGISFKVTGNPEEWTNQDVVLTIEAESDTALHEEPYSFDGGKTWQKEPTKSFNMNTEVHVLVRDVDEDSDEQIVNITKIDKTVPDITITNDGSMLTATIKPEITVSEYTYQWYKDGELIEGATSLVYKTSGDGLYKLVVTTGAKTVVEKVYEIATTYTVTFDSNGGSKVASQTVKKNNTVKKPTNPTRSGYTFKGWTLNGNDYNFSSKVTSDIKLVAKWSKNSSSGGGGSNKKPTPSPKPASKITLSKSNITIQAGMTTILTAKTSVSGTLTWTSSNNNVASVSQTGQVRAKKAGTTTITVYASDGSKATCKVTVSN